MIQSKKDLKEWLQYEKLLYNIKLKDYILSNPKVKIWKYVFFLRNSEYHRNNKGLIHLILFSYYRLRKNKLGHKINIEIGDNSCGKGLLIYHYGYIVINRFASIGKNAKFHGCNCIGNLNDENRVPIIGDDVEFGFGSAVIGDVKLGNKIKIGANATVVKDCLAPGATLVGTPAKPLIKEMK